MNKIFTFSQGTKIDIVIILRQQLWAYGMGRRIVQSIFLALKLFTIQRYLAIFWQKYYETKDTISLIYTVFFQYGSIPSLMCVFFFLTNFSIPFLVASLEVSLIFYNLLLISFTFQFKKKRLSISFFGEKGIGQFFDCHCFVIQRV